MRVRVLHYDGISALGREAMLTTKGDAFMLVEAGQTTGPFAFPDLVPVDALGAPRFGLKRRPGWRIDLIEPAPADIAARLPGRVHYGGMVDRWGLWPSVVVFTVLAAIAVVLVLRTPPLVARLVPASVEQRLGDVMIGDFGRNGCVDPAGLAALERLKQRIDPYDPRLEVDVVKLPVVNAVTLPGGRIVVFDGLIQAARSPDEVAGVIGHEIGHVRHRDVMESLLRQLGLSVLLGGMEGHVGGVTNAVLATTYSRGAEAKADDYAILLLKEAKVSPVATADFFTRLGGKAERMERMTAYVASHPVSADRARRFRAAAVRDKATYTLALGPDQWQALRSICRGASNRINWRF